MSGLALVLAEAAGQRAAAALDVAAAAAALGEPVRLFLTGDALALLGGPELTMLEELGAHIAVCQTAMARQGRDAGSLPADVAPSGLVAFLAETRAFRLLLG
jgi:predicted peroxiredoxin